MFDPESGALEGYDSNAEREYVPKVRDAQGRLFSNQLELLLGTARSELFGTEVEWRRWMPPEGKVLPMPQEEAGAHAALAAAAGRRAEADAQRAETETQRAEAERRRAEAERRRADVEAERARGL